MFWWITIDQTTELDLKLSRLECLQMVESKSCDHNQMECSDDGCIFNKIPTGESEWLRDVVLQTYHCKFHRKRIVAETNTSQIFSNSLNTCTPPDTFCSLAHSIVIWNQTDVHTNMYKIVTYSHNYTKIGNILFSNETNFLFQLSDSFVEDTYTIYKTTNGLYLFTVNSEKPNSLPALMSFYYKIYDSYESKETSIGDGIELEMAEQDFFRYVEDSIYRYKFLEEYSKDCRVLINQLNMMSKFDRTFHRLNDLKGNPTILYSNLGLLFLPRCQNIYKISISEIGECFHDAKVTFITEKDEQFVLFLDQDNFLIDNSPKVECSTINSRQFINNSHFLIRYRDENRIVGVADLKFVDITKQNSNFDSLNFVHNSQIIDGFDKINNFHEPTNQENADMNENFHLLPEDYVVDKQNIFSSLKNTITCFFKEISNTIIDKCKTALLIFGITVLALLIFKAYVVVEKHWKFIACRFASSKKGGEHEHVPLDDFV